MLYNLPQHEKVGGVADCYYCHEQLLDSARAPASYEPLQAMLQIFSHKQVTHNRPSHLAQLDPPEVLIIMQCILAL